MSYEYKKAKSHLLAKKADLLNQLACRHERFRRDWLTSTEKPKLSLIRWQFRLRKHLLLIEQRLAELEDRKTKELITKK